jgi:hypothetical protein
VRSVEKKINRYWEFITRPNIIFVLYTAPIFIMEKHTVKKTTGIGKVE